ncbi:hypothetical protein D9619_011636 [Psilocybe cf. subviscida]|uniref:Arrestin C-terminal-like domain-containing protein n=1 Tax=Psilocybe cf. subviscida TaxID=2480587 RepID=A0A8H5F9Z1_9AGAR|nr:hypothetical protein D9619_011636 [Psilocybe cf. subviscida]
MPFSSNTPLHPSHLNPQVQEQAEVDESSTTNRHSPHGQGKDKGKAQDRSESGYAHPHSSTSSHPHLAGPYHPHSTEAAPYHPHSTSATPFHPSPSGSVSASPSTSGFHLPSFHIPRVGSLGRIPTSSSSWAHVNDHPDNHPYPPSAFSSALPSANNSATNLPETLNLPQAPPSLKYNTITDIQNKNSGTSSSTSMGFRDRDRHEREHKDKHHDSHSKEKPHLDIILDAPFLTLRGTGPDVEPTTLSGHVALFLTEATSVKEITLQFRGKAKIPMPATESLLNSGTSITYVVCNHDWSFLEGDKRHARTLKAGRHFFPFHLEIGGTLPSSLSTSALGGASVAYKLRAVATRPGFLGSLSQHSTLQAVAPVTILRAFTPEALEYQQTLEIENTWPEKVMYSLMLPHKAWAAGDEVAAVIKFSPLRKGVRVLEVETALWETVKVYARSGTQEDTRRICSVKHGIVAGRAVEIDWGDDSGATAGSRSGSTARSGTQERQGSSSRPPSTQHSAPTALSDLTRLSSEPGNFQSDMTSSSNPTHANQNGANNIDDDDEEGDYENADVVTFVKLRIPLSAGAPPGGSLNPITSLPNTPAGDHFPPSNAPSYFGANDSSAAPPLFNANGTFFHPKDKDSLAPTPSHSLDPIVVSHRVRWSILIRNRDGHTSELRCSLPVVILDSRVLEEARGISVPTRRLMMGSVGLRLNGEEGRQRRRRGRRQEGGTDYHAYGDEDGFGDEDDDSDDFNLGFPRTTDDGSGAHIIDGVPGSPNAQTGALVGANAGDDDRELPSYTAHVRDRVANMFLPEAVTMRVSNPWLGRVGPVTTPGGTLTTPPPTSPAPDGAGGLQDGASHVALTQQLEDVAHTANSSGRNSTADLPQMTSLADAVNSIMSSSSTPAGGVSEGASQPQSQVGSPSHRAQRHLPPVPGHAGDLTPLDWVNSELLLSLSDEPVRRLAGSNPGTSGSAGAAAALTAAGLGIESGMLAYTTPSPGAPASTSGNGSSSGSPHQSVESHMHLPNASSVRAPAPQPHYIAGAHGGSGPGSAGRRSGSRWGSRAGSRANSRANSPDRAPPSTGGSRRPSAEALRPISRPVSPAVGGFGGLAMSMSPAHATPAASDTPSSTHSRSRVNSTTSQGHLNLPAAPALTPEGALPSPAGSGGGPSPSASGFFPPQGSGGQPLSRPTSAADVQAPVDKHEKHDKSHGHGGRNLHSLFKATMRPFSALTGHRHHNQVHDRDREREARAHGHAIHAQRNGQHHSGEPSREGSPEDGERSTNTNTRSVPSSITIPSNPYATQSTSVLPPGGYAPPMHSPPPHSALSSPGLHQTLSSPALIPPMHSPLSTGPYSSYSTNSQFAAHMLNTPASIAGPAILHRAFTEVPDYSIAARGFLGGVPPLDSMRGLPSYEEAARDSRPASRLHPRGGSEPATPAVQPTMLETTVSNAEDNALSRQSSGSQS